ncbi:hypothetical protein A7U60_g1657 [Sanghuangporus baumii]|uniref:tryptophan--tRNA ligase n=1 Tax=Sanghuangporus baumii TaxID=108892 RepID=A0A9Q5I3M1_SANBA|nr:hypothetical protein A7U60_g1657 [Sanghuangporus baumii]
MFGRKLVANKCTKCCRVSCMTTKRYASTANKTNSRKVIFSGIQPTGVPHIGNYLGALRNWVKMQREAEPDDQLIFSVVGWHALTLPQDPRKLLQTRNDTFAALVAIGLDPERSIIFHQDQKEVLYFTRTRLAISRNANDESEVDESMLNTGLLTYPVLQAADVLAYKTTHVPVGDDQQQHLELCRDLAESFNRSTNNSLFPLPETVFNPAKRILSLKDPSAKMSKSARDENSRILLTDDTITIRNKIRGAVTDSLSGVSYDTEARPGTSNLLTLLAGCLDEDVHAVAERYKDKGHGALKIDVTDVLEETLREPRAEFFRLRADPGHLQALADKGAERAKEISQRTLAEVRRLVGLLTEFLYLSTMSRSRHSSRTRSLNAEHPVVMTIAGSDPSGGAGIQVSETRDAVADLKTFTALQCFGTSVITALTAQNTTGVDSVFPTPPEFIEKQLSMVLADMDVSAFKTGMLYDAANARAVARGLKDFYKNHEDIIPPLVIDPVCVSTSGHTLLEPDAVTVLIQELFPLAKLITPNKAEAELLLAQASAKERKEIRSIDGALDVACSLANLGSCDVLLKGGHLTVSARDMLSFIAIQRANVRLRIEWDGIEENMEILQIKKLDVDAPLVIDVLYERASGNNTIFARRRIDSTSTHGTGCTLSAAIASYLARGCSVRDAVRLASDYTYAGIKAAFPLGRGHGPLNHMHSFTPRILPLASGNTTIFARRRIDSTSTHGTGCTLSAAIASYLARGHSVRDAVRLASDYTYAGIKAAFPLGRGHGPLNHMHSFTPRILPLPSKEDPYPFTRALIRSNADVWKHYVEHPFVRQLGEGTLRRESFVHFVKQDYQYLKYYARAYGLLVAKSRRFADIKPATDTILNVLNEVTMHRSYCSVELGISEVELEMTPESSATTAYGAFILDSGLRGDETLLIITLAACLLGYGEVGLWLNNQAELPDSWVRWEGNPYLRWIEDYSGVHYQNAVRTGLDILEHAAQEDPPSPRRFEQWKEVWGKCTMLEKKFWDMAMELS